MKCEYVGFYPATERKNKYSCIGTIHIYCIDYKIDLRGIQVFKRGNCFHFMPPGRWVKDEDGKEVRYPFIGFTDKKDDEALKEFFKDTCTKELKKELGINSKEKHD